MSQRSTFLLWVLASLLLSGCGTRVFTPADDDDSAPGDDDDSAAGDDDDSAPGDDDDSAPGDDDDSAPGDDDDSASGDDDDDDSVPGDDDDSTPILTATLLLSEIAEPAEPTSWMAKFVEVYNAGNSVVALQSVELHRYANGATTSGSVALEGTLGPGEVYVIAYQLTEFQSAFGVDADLEASNVVTGNGDDVYELRENGLVLDTYGEVGVDGTGTAWEYSDSIVHRAPASQPNFGATPLDMNEWSVTDWSTALSAGAITPGTHSN